MGKYDCTKARDFLHEIARAKQCCTQTLTSDSCGDCPLAIRHFKGYDRFCLNRRDITDNSFMEMPEDNFSEMVERLQKWSDSHTEMRALTEEEITVLTGLKLLGFKYIAADKDGAVFAHRVQPEKRNFCWHSDRCLMLNMPSNELFNGIMEFSDEKPLVIDEILNERN